MRVLSVDDVPEMADLSKKVLNKYGIECDVAIGYSEAMEMVKEHEPGYYNAILTDYPQESPHFI